MGTVILSTPKGVVSGKEARRLGVGGEILCEIW
jgi:small subunit ribosomal protein S8